MAEIQLNKVFKMLDRCALGHTKALGQHRWIIDYRGRRFYLPTGQHSRRRSGRGEVERRFVKALCRRFDIFDCALEVLPQLRQ